MSTAEGAAASRRNPWVIRTATVEVCDRVWFAEFELDGLLPSLLSGDTAEFEDFTKEDFVDAWVVFLVLCGSSDITAALLYSLGDERRHGFVRDLRAAGMLAVDVFDVAPGKVGLRFKVERHDLATTRTPSVEEETPQPKFMLSVKPDGSDLMPDWERADREARERAHKSAYLYSTGPGIAREVRESIAARYLTRVPKAVWIPSVATGFSEQVPIGLLSDDPARSGTVLEKLLSERGAALAADGHYNCQVLADSRSGGHGFLVTYTAQGEDPLFTECLAAGKYLVPKAFARPLAHGLHKPRFPGGVVSLIGASPEALDPVEAERGLGELLDQATDSGALERVRTLAAREGSDAFGWYQPFHSFDSDSWGIYLRAESLADLAVSLWEELRGKRVARPGVSLWLVVRLIWRHELWHARMEALSLREELARVRPLYRRYQRNVYRKTVFRSLNREEATANAFAWEGLLLDLKQLEDSQIFMGDDAAVVRGFIEAVFALSPPGYRDWRLASNPAFRRALACELFTGRLEGSPTPAPLETVLRHAPGPFSQDEDVPTRLVGEGSLADTLFSTPSLREVEKVLRARGYREIPGRGKGSHILWVSSDGRSSFPLPRRDPLSMVVFRNLLHHLGLTKGEYMVSRSAA